MPAVKVTAVEENMTKEKKKEKGIMEEKVEENDQEFVVLDFDGEEVECAIIDEFEMEGKHYIVLFPEDEEDAYIYSYKEDDEGEITLSNLEEEEFKKAVELYKKRNS